MPDTWMTFEMPLDNVILAFCTPCIRDFMHGISLNRPILFVIVASQQVNPELLFVYYAEIIYARESVSLYYIGLLRHSHTTLV